MNQMHLIVHLLPADAIQKMDTIQIAGNNFQQRQ